MNFTTAAMQLFLLDAAIDFTNTITLTLFFSKYSYYVTWFTYVSINYIS